MNDYHRRVVAVAVAVAVVVSCGQTLARQWQTIAAATHLSQYQRGVTGYRFTILSNNVILVF